MSEVLPDGWLSGTLQELVYSETYHSKLLYYYITSPTFLNQKDKLTTGSTQEALTDTNAVKLDFPLPPLNEQKRIVAKLDKIIIMNPGGLGL